MKANEAYKERQSLLAKLAMPLACALLVGCPASRPPADDYREITARTFKVERVVDGDTFKVVYDAELTSVRILGINAPEKRDARGPAATAALAKLISGRVVRLEFATKRKRDNFGRLLCKVYVGQLDVGADMIRRGHAVPYVPRRR